MFEYITGTLSEASTEKAVLDVGGLGYKLFIPLSTFEKLPQTGEKLKLFISTVIREDSHKLYGFLTIEERDLFETLNDISGIGPRISLSLLGHMSLIDFVSAIEHSNTKAITKVPGIGKKMAERLVLEMRDKLGKESKQKISLASPAAKGVVGDAIQALVNLGYPPLEAQKTVQKVLPDGQEPPLSELISLALKAKK